MKKNIVLMMALIFIFVFSGCESFFKTVEKTPTIEKTPFITPKETFYPKEEQKLQENSNYIPIGISSNSEFITILGAYNEDCFYDFKKFEYDNKKYEEISSYENIINSKIEYLQFVQNAVVWDKFAQKKQVTVKEYGYVLQESNDELHVWVELNETIQNENIVLFSEHDAFPRKVRYEENNIYVDLDGDEDIEKIFIKSNSLEILKKDRKIQIENIGEIQNVLVLDVDGDNIFEVFIKTFSLEGIRFSFYSIDDIPICEGAVIIQFD